MHRRNLLGVATGLAAVAAIGISVVMVTTAAPGSTRTRSVAAGERTDCAAAGVAHAGARALTFAGGTVMVAAELQVGERPAELTGAVAASPDGATAVRITDAKGADRLDVSTDAGASWATVATGRDLAYPAVSPSGARIAFGAAGALTVADAAAGWKPVAVAMPGEGKQLAQYARFVDENRLLLAVEVGVPGVADRFAALSDVWLHDLAWGSWQRLTTTEPDLDRWSIAKTPVFDRDGSLLYVRQTGLGSGTDADLRTELRRVTGGADVVVRKLADRWGIVAVDGDGSVLWNAPDEHGQWQLVSAGADGSLTPLGCGRSWWAPSLNHDPDYAP